MKRPPHHVSQAPGGYTLLEFVVALMVFGVALSGLFPLVTILSRDLLPVRGADSSSPARDWNQDAPSLVNHRHTWYLTAYDDPWVRKLGAAARATSSCVTSSTPLPLQSPILVQDDDNTDGLDADGDAQEDYAGDSGAGWQYDGAAVSAMGGDRNRKIALPTGETSTGAAAWNLKVTTAGWYSIQATWTAAEDQVTDARYAVLRTNSPTATLGTATVNQQAAPVGVADSDGRLWAPVGSVVQLAAGDAVQVQLSDVRATSTETGKYVVADGVRIVQNAVKIKSIERSLGGVNANSYGADATVRVTVTVHIPQ
jgi:prepilin-type N-terminal cleavage/methylation domain-containing protein